MELQWLALAMEVVYFRGARWRRRKIEIAMLSIEIYRVDKAAAGVVTPRRINWTSKPSRVGPLRQKKRTSHLEKSARS